MASQIDEHMLQNGSVAMDVSAHYGHWSSYHVWYTFSKLLAILQETTHSYKWDIEQVKAPNHSLLKNENRLLSKCKY